MAKNHTLKVLIQLQENTPYGKELRKARTRILIERVCRQMMQERFINIEFLIKVQECLLQKHILKMHLI